MLKPSINVTQPSMPPLEEFNKYLKEIWQNKWLTNSGKFHNQLEESLADYLGVKYLSLVSNGTLSLIAAIHTLEKKGEVITTPFSFVATTHALNFLGIKPVFVDIEPGTCNINPEKIEAAITTETAAILPVHIFGNPCKVKEIQKIADKYHLPVIYDACQAFGVEQDGNSILNFGDLSVLSFHATKVFSTFEGGAVISHNAETKKRIDHFINFGIEDEVTCNSLGINGKLNEIQSAFGLLKLKYIDEETEQRKRLAQLYTELLQGTAGITIVNTPTEVKSNYYAFPVLIDPKLFGSTRDQLFNKLRANGILVRRYYYPLISNTNVYNGLPSAQPENLPVANKVASQIICLPIYPDLDHQTVCQICNLIMGK